MGDLPMKRLSFLLVLGLFFCCGSKVFAQETDWIESEEQILCPNARSAVLYEGKTDTLLYNQEMNLRLPPASMTKIMTLLLTYEALEKGSIQKDTVVTVSENAASMEGSKAFLSVGEKITVDELLKCVCIASANDAAICLAETICGSEEVFVDKMNEKVASLNLKNTHFSDCTGLTSRNHYTSAYDMALISDYLIDHYPDVLVYTSLKEDYIRKDTASPFWLVNTNKLLGRVEGINGLKTGYTSFSGYCITLHMEKNNMGLISVVMGYQDSKIRNGESVQLLNYGAMQYEMKTFYQEGAVLQTIDSILYKDKVNVLIKQAACYLVKRGEEVEITPKIELDFHAGFSGKVALYCKDKLVSEVPLVLSGELKRRTLWELCLAVFVRSFLE